MSVEVIEQAFGRFLIKSDALQPPAIPLNESGEVAIYGQRGIQDSMALPYIVFSCIGYEEQPLVGAAPDVASATFELQCVGTTADAVHSLAGVVRGMFRFQGGQIEMGDLTVIATWIVPNSPDIALIQSGLMVSVVQVGVEFYL